MEAYMFWLTVGVFIGTALTSIITANDDKEQQAYEKGLRDGFNAARKMMRGDRRL